jgi:hypothetical protein
MLFDEIFLANLANIPVTGIHDISQKVIESLKLDNYSEWDSDSYEILLQTYALFNSLEEAELLSDQIYIPEIAGYLTEDCGKIFSSSRCK